MINNCVIQANGKYTGKKVKSIFENEEEKNFLITFSLTVPLMKSFNADLLSKKRHNFTYFVKMQLFIQDLLSWPQTKSFDYICTVLLRHVADLFLLQSRRLF